MTKKDIVTFFSIRTKIVEQLTKKLKIDKEKLDRYSIRDFREFWWGVSKVKDSIYICSIDLVDALEQLTEKIYRIALTSRTKSFLKLKSVSIATVVEGEAPLIMPSIIILDNDKYQGTIS